VTVYRDPQCPESKCPECGRPDCARTEGECWARAESDRRLRAWMAEGARPYTRTALWWALWACAGALLPGPWPFKVAAVVGGIVAVANAGVAVCIRVMAGGRR
jgi:hypothetical protein